MRIDRDKFLNRLSTLGLGTGTLATKAGVPPDYIQRLLALEEAEDGPETEAIIDILGPDILDRPTIADLSINATIALIQKGEIDAEEVYEVETSKIRPRKGLLRYLNENYGLGEE